MSFDVNNVWTAPSKFAFGQIGENWWNGHATSAPGIDLWGVAGNLQDPSVPVAAMLFNDSLPMIFDVPGTSSEPIYGTYGSTPTAGPSTTPTPNPPSSPTQNSGISY